MAEKTPKLYPVQKRTRGITIVSIVGIIWALITLVSGVALVAVVSTMDVGVITNSALIAAYGTVLYIATLMSSYSIILSGFGIVVGIIIIAVSLMLLYGFYRLWDMKKSGWKIVMTFETIGLLISLASLNAIGVIIPLVIVMYLWKKRMLFK
jgi:hypothetical protein